METPTQSTFVRPTPNKAIRAWARRQYKTSYGSLLVAGLLAYGPSVLLTTLVTALGLPQLCRLLTNSLFFILYYPVTLACAKTCTQCYLYGRVGPPVVTYFYREKGRLKTALLLGATLSAFSFVAGAIPELAILLFPTLRVSTPLAAGLQNGIQLACMLLQLYITLRLFTLPYAFIAGEAQPAAALLKACFRLPRRSTGRVLGMMLSFIGWLLLLSIPAGLLFFLLSAVGGGTPLFFLLIMSVALFIYPYISVSLAGLAHTILLANPAGDATNHL